MTTTKKIKCPQCQFILKIPATNTLGRKRYAITFANICKALQLRDNGRPDWTKTKQKIWELYGLYVSAGFTQRRFDREAEDRGITVYELVQMIKMADRHQRINEVFEEK